MKQPSPLSLNKSDFSSSSEVINDTNRKPKIYFEISNEKIPEKSKRRVTYREPLKRFLTTNAEVNKTGQNKE